MFRVDEVFPENENPVGEPLVTLVHVPPLLYCHWYGPADAVTDNDPLPVAQIVRLMG